MPEGHSPPRKAAEILREAAADLAAARRAARLEAPAGAGASLPPGGAAAAPEHEDRLRDLLRLARHVTSILELQPLLDTLVEAFVAATGAERGFLMLDDGAGTLEFRAAFNLDSEQVRQGGFEISRGTIQEVAESGRSVFVEDVLADGRYGARDSVVLLRLRSYSCVPLLHGGRVLGVCYTDSRQPGRVLPEPARSLLQDFASQAAQAIDNARRHGELLVAKSRLEAENQDLRRQIDRRYRFESILGESAAMQRLFDTVEKVMKSAVHVLLQGESGTGKELIARALHCNGPLHAAAFVAVNAGALPENLLESELFGHRRGAFTGAVEDRQGLFEEADGGTLFLDEVGEMSLPLQVKLLRALQEGEIRRVGDSSVRRVKVRIIAATNRELDAEVRAGRFREDLFYRLNVVGILVPPLRERGNDVLLLAEDFTRRFAKQHGKRIAGLAPEAVRWLLQQRWEGNVRELQNCIERAVTLSEPGAGLTVEVLETPWARTPARAHGSRGTLRATLDAVERDEVRRALEACGGQVAAAARRLGVSRQHLHNLLHKHGLVSPKGTKSSRSDTQ